MAESISDVELTQRITLTDFRPPQADMSEEVLAGLLADKKVLSPKYFYDAKGSALFDAITELPEYYPTRTETNLLRAHRAEVASLVGEAPFLVEYGSGSSVKVQLLLDALRPAGYMPIDISREHLQGAARDVARRYAWLTVYPTCADYSQAVPLPAIADDAQTMAFFPGSSIGNFDPTQAREFLANVATTVGGGGYLLIGVDRKKDASVLELAYNDSAGVTEQFNLNVIDHINSALVGDLQRDAFRHRAHYNAAIGRIEMHLDCVRGHDAQIDGHVVSFATGESIHTENSYKYDPEGFAELARAGGFEVERHWSDTNAWFSLFLCRAAA